MNSDNDSNEIIQDNLGKSGPTDKRPVVIGENILIHPLKHRHLHQGLEIGTIVSGRSSMFINEKAYVLSAGDSYYLNGIFPHGHEPLKDCKLDIIYMHLKAESVIMCPPPRNDMTLLEPFLISPDITEPVIRKNRELHEKIRASLQCQDQGGPLAHAKVWANTLFVLVAVSETFYGKMTDMERLGRNNIYLSKALYYIHRHYREPISVHDMAKACGLSLSHFSHLFSKILQVSPVVYRNKLRIASALEKIMTTQEKITAIALDSGFDSLSQFHELFRKTTGLSPAAFRKKQDNV
jgi:AraC-like DNA-binding protein